MTEYQPQVLSLEVTRSMSCRVINTPISSINYFKINIMKYFGTLKCSFLTFMEPCIAKCVFYITNEMQLIQCSLLLTRRFRWSSGKHAGLWHQSLRLQTRPKPLDFSEVKILSMPSSGGEVKESVPCPSFAARKRT